MIYYEHFCPEHIGTVLFITTCITATLLWSRKLNEKRTDILVRVLSVTLFSAEAIQDILAYHEGFPITSFLPMHLCNLGIFVNLLASFTRGKVSSYFSEVSLVLIMPGAIGAILFPDWNYRPFWDWLNLTIFFTHLLLTLIPLLFLVKGRTHVKFSHFWYSLLFMLVVVPPIYAYDMNFDNNYMFLRDPVDGSPLEWVYNLSDGKHYILGLFFLLVGVLAFEYALIIGLRALKKKLKKAKHSEAQAEK
ncbi:MAG: YwaF family protein [Clostridiales bacterium]|nr:YwaF family protein [Clostridiales bacterium]